MFLDFVFFIVVMKGYFRIFLICVVISFFVMFFFFDVMVNIGIVDYKIEIMKFKIEIIN